MPINPYEPPQTEPSEVRRASATIVSATHSIIAVVAAGVMGASLFVGVMEGLYFVFEAIPETSGLKMTPVPNFTAFTLAVAGSLLVLLTTDWYIQRRRPAIGSAAIGMLLASPFALVLALGLGNIAYGMGTKRIPGGLIVVLLAYFSFFATLGLGGWMAIGRVRRASES